MRPLILKGHTMPVKSVLFNLENDLLFSASTDRLVTLWSADYGERIGTYFHRAAVYTMDISDDSKYLVSGDSTGGIYFWETSTGSLLKNIEMDPKYSIRSVNFSSGDNQIAVTYGGRTKESDSAVHVFNMKDILSATSTEKDKDKDKKISLKPLKEFKAINNQKFSKMRWMNLNKNIICTTEEGYLFHYSYDTEAIVKEKKIHEGTILDLDLSPKEEVLLTASKDGKALVIDPDTFDIVNTLFPQSPTRNINSCRLSPLISLDEESKQMYHAFIAGGQESRDVTTTHAKKGGFDILLYNIMFGSELGAIQGHFGPINTLAVSSDGMIIASGAEEASVRVHRLENEEYLTIENK